MVSHFNAQTWNSADPARSLGISEHTVRRYLDLLGDGATSEGLVVEEVLRALRPPEGYFWGTHGGAELDLFLPIGDRRIGIEIKRSDAPTVSASMRSGTRPWMRSRI